MATHIVSAMYHVSCEKVLHKQKQQTWRLQEYASHFTLFVANSPKKQLFVFVL